MDIGIIWESLILIIMYKYSVFSFTKIYIIYNIKMGFPKVVVINKGLQY